jgi:hypothetical protein
MMCVKCGYGRWEGEIVALVHNIETRKIHDVLNSVNTPGNDVESHDEMCASLWNKIIRSYSDCLWTSELRNWDWRQWQIVHLRD